MMREGKVGTMDATVKYMCVENNCRLSLFHKIVHDCRNERRGNRRCLKVLDAEDLPQGRERMMMMTTFYLFQTHNLHSTSIVKSSRFISTEETVNSIYCDKMGIDPPYISLRESISLHSQSLRTTISWICPHCCWAFQAPRDPHLEPKLWEFAREPSRLATILPVIRKLLLT